MLCYPGRDHGEKIGDHTWAMKKQSRQIKTMGSINNLSVLSFNKPWERVVSVLVWDAVGGGLLGRST